MVNQPMNKNSTVYLSLGSNIGDRESNLKNVLKMLKLKDITLSKISSIYRTEPVGNEEQPYFYNIAVKALTYYTPEKLLEIIKSIEIDMGRKWSMKWGPRIIDIDILFYNDLIIDTTALKIPHPEILKRNFVLIPMNEIEPDFTHPVEKKSIKDLLSISKSSKKVEKVKSIGEI